MLLPGWCHSISSVIPVSKHAQNSWSNLPFFFHSRDSWGKYLKHAFCLSYCTAAVLTPSSLINQKQICLGTELPRVSTHINTSPMQECISRTWERQTLSVLEVSCAKRAPFLTKTEASFQNRVRTIISGFPLYFGEGSRKYWFTAALNLQQRFKSLL